MTTLQLSQFSSQAIMFAGITYSIALLLHVAEWSITRTPTRSFELTPAGSPGTPQAGSTDEADARLHRVEFFGRMAVTMTLFALLINTAGVVSRGLAAQRVPWGNMYEFTITGCAAAVTAYLILLRFQPIRWLGLPVNLLAVVSLMLAALYLDVPAGPLVPALHSYWLYIHVTAAMVATGAFTVGSLASALYLVRARAEARGDTRGWLSSRLPATGVIDRVAHRMNAFGFPVWTFAALIAGPIWARYAWGRYWGWDPKEVWAFVTWIAYAAYLHAQSTAGWRGMKAAILALIGFASLLFNFIGINFWGGGLHSYSGK